VHAHVNIGHLKNETWAKGRFSTRMARVRTPGMK
jgi:hypothetical protein